jgi:hypothetical protein
MGGTRGLFEKDHAPTGSVNVEGLMRDRAKEAPENLNWQESIVDLMKLLNMDSSLGARKIHGRTQRLSRHEHLATPASDAEGQGSYRRRPGRGWRRRHPRLLRKLVKLDGMNISQKVIVD